MERILFLCLHQLTPPQTQFDEVFDLVMCFIAPDAIQQHANKDKRWKAAKGGRRNGTHASCSTGRLCGSDGLHIAGASSVMYRPHFRLRAALLRVHNVEKTRKKIRIKTMATKGGRVPPKCHAHRFLPPKLKHEKVFFLCFGEKCETRLKQNVGDFFSCRE